MSGDSVNDMVKAVKVHREAMELWNRIRLDDMAGLAADIDEKGGDVPEEAKEAYEEWVDLYQDAIEATEDAQKLYPSEEVEKWYDAVAEAEGYYARAAMNSLAGAHFDVARL
jgi:hypothetical protein